MEKKRKPLGVTVKETIDYMYALLADQPNGVVYPVNRSLGGTAGQIVAILVKRGIIEKKCVASGVGNSYRYKWLADSCPTKVLYGSVTQELRDAWKEMHNKSKEKKSREASECRANVESVASAPVQDESREQEKPVRISEGVDLENPIRVEKPTKETVHTEDVTLSIYGIDELVSELRLRGCTIENNKIVLVKRVEYAL